MPKATNVSGIMLRSTQLIISIKLVTENYEYDLISANRPKYNIFFSRDHSIISSTGRTPVELLLSLCVRLSRTLLKKYHQNVSK